MRAGSIVLLLLLTIAVANSQKNTNPDDAFLSDPALHNYLDKSPYQHGSLHGYEDGYQAGDIDFHLQRPQPEFKKVKEFRSATRGYVDGDKDEFRAGYQDGYQVGYQDALAGRPFAAVDRLQAAAEQKPLKVPDSDMDQGDGLAAQADPAPPPPVTALKVPISALFPDQQLVRPPEPAAKDSALARIMNNLRRTFMPAVITPQAVVSGNQR